MTTRLPLSLHTRHAADPELVSLEDWLSCEAEATGPTPPPAEEGHAALKEEAQEVPRYEDRGFITRGGMGEIRRVFDRRLDRVIVQKILRSEHPRTVQRFWVEATVTARLEHPGIVPVHDFGSTEDGAPFFTMKEIGGRTFAQVIADLHQASRVTWGRAPDGTTLRRAVDALHRAAQTVAYAHGRGILHRDLKPQNLMVGAFGEVLVLDWGIALVDPARWTQDLPRPDAEGQVTGTPTYMPPEQARGELHRMGPWTDVFALGACLFQLLAGRPPRQGATRAMLESARAGLDTPLAEAASLPLPEALVRLCTLAMAPEPEARMRDAGAFAQVLSDWLDGDRREEEGRQLVARAAALLPRVDALRADARFAIEEAREQLDALPAWAPSAQKAGAWRLEDKARAMELEAEQTEIEVVQILRAALTRAPDLDSAHAMLADHFRQRHEDALANRDQRSAVQAEAQLRRHDRGAHVEWLAGTGLLSLDTDPPGVSVQVLRLVERDRRLVPEDTGVRAVTPVRRLRLPAGSYLCRLLPEDRPMVDLPVLVERAGHADGTRPGDRRPTPLALPPAHALGPDECLVPAGWALLGDPQARGGEATRRLWLDSFVLRRHPVTNAEFIAFLDALVAQGQEEEALALQPRQDTGEAGTGAPVYQRLPDGRFALGPDSSGDLWRPDWPVCLVTLAAARRFAEWTAQVTGLPWRLPWEAEWEKAARGVDGRAYPWGDFGEPSWFNCAAGHQGRPIPASVQAHPLDCSVYGLLGMAGNMRDLSLDTRDQPYRGASADGLWTPPPEAWPPRDWIVSRGGAWSGSAQFGRCGTRFSQPAELRLGLVSFRLCRSLTDRTARAPG